MNIRCLIVDDEPLARQLLTDYVGKVSFLELVGEASNAIQAFEMLNTTKVDLLLLDVKMPTMSGLEFLNSLKHPPLTILTTAYRDFAPESYELDVLDYLIKPVLFERFLKAIHKAMKKIEEGATYQYTPFESAAFITLKSGAKTYKVELSDIIYIESQKDYLKVFLSTGKSIITKYRISDMEQELAKKHFLRIHRSFIVNPRRITSYTSNEIELQDIGLPVGANYRTEVERFLNENW